MSARPASRLKGWGFCVPETIVTNDDLAPIVDTSDEWIQKRTGIRERHYVDDDKGSVALAARATFEALAMADMGAEDIDAILCCSLSPDVDSPGNSALLHEQLGISPRYAFDIRNQCSGFLYGLATADQLIRTGAAKHVLLVGSEVHSSGLDFEGARGRDVTVLFGDGAGAVVVGPSDDGERGLLEWRLHSEGRYAEKLCLFGPAHRRRPRIDASLCPPENAFSYPVMEGRYVFKHACERMSEVVRGVLEAGGYTLEDLNLLLPHQANLRINQFVALGLGLDESRVANNIDRYGNTTAATIPILLCETHAAGRLHAGDLICFAAFGAGFTWGAALYRW